MITPQVAIGANEARVASLVPAGPMSVADPLAGASVDTPRTMVHSARTVRMVSVVSGAIVMMIVVGRVARVIASRGATAMTAVAHVRMVSVVSGVTAMMIVVGRVVKGTASRGATVTTAEVPVTMVSVVNGLTVTMTAVDRAAMMTVVGRAAMMTAGAATIVRRRCIVPARRRVPTSQKPPATTSRISCPLA